MKRTYYNAGSLRGSLERYERKFNMSSADFHAAYVDYDEARLEGIPRAHRFSWAAFYDEWCRLSDESCVAAGDTLRLH